MDWTKFNNHGESDDRAFEIMCNLLFEIWCKTEYKDKLVQFAFVNGAGGDGGVEAFGILDNGEIIAVQSKWFPNRINKAQIKQIENSLETALQVRPNIKNYIVCIPRSLGSRRKVKDGKVTDNTEETKWKKFVDEAKTQHSGIEVILWDETRIQEKLIQPQAVGIYKYWFENSIVFDESIDVSFNKAIYGWAKARYIPEVYSFGYIHKKLESFLGSVNLSAMRYKEAHSFKERLVLLEQVFIDLLSLGIPEKEKSLQKKIEKDVPVIKNWISVFEKAEQSIKYGNKIKFDNLKIGLVCEVTNFRDCSLYYGKYFHVREIEILLDNIENDFSSLQMLLEETTDNRLIILGNQGTGKTAGIVAESTMLYENKTHLPILVHAKDFSDGHTWLDILRKTIGLSDTWDERELLSALQTIALLRNNNVGDYYVEPKCVICVDGIDEAKNWSFWKEKIDEAFAFYDDFPRIKFVFLSRPYVFEKGYELDYHDRIFHIPVEGDVSAAEVCDKYFSTYHVDIGEKTWVKKHLKTPDSVRLFCDVFRNRGIDPLQQNIFVITSLYEKKIDELDKEFRDRIRRNVANGLLQKALFEIADVFTKSKAVSYSEILESVSVQVKNALDDILPFLSDEGYLYAFKRRNDAYLYIDIMYSWGCQPVLDYILAKKLYEKLEKGEEVSIDCINGTYQMLALITVEEGKLLFEYSNINSSANDMFNLVCYALANCSLETAGRYRGYAKLLLSTSASNFREIVNEVIIPCAEIDNHPLGATLLDEFLMEFKSSAKRDVWWSIPAHLRGNCNADWRTCTEINFESIELNHDGKYYGKPLILAWSLTAVNNELRQKSKMKLTKWAIDNPLGFWNLFCKCIKTNDEQMAEDLFAIAYGIALVQFVPDEYLLEAFKWMLDNVFSNEGLIKYENTAIRYYAEGIIKIAATKALCDFYYVDVAKPPYIYKSSSMSLYKDALNAGRMSGYSAIDYDLARYVLCDHLDSFFRTDYKSKVYRPETQEFIDKYSKEGSALDKFNVDGLIIAMAYQYLIEQGWTKELFWLSKDQEDLGVDKAIRLTYSSASHGSKSRVMCVAEKYVWLAKHRIEARLANELPYCEDYRTYEYVKDYSQLDSYFNPYQDYINQMHENDNTTWLNFELLASATFEEVSSEKIVGWMQDNYVPDFEKWLNPINHKVFIKSTTSVENKLSEISETVWISSGVIETEKFNMFLDSLNSYSENRAEIANVDDFHSYQDCSCYCTPLEACLIHPDREIENKLSFTGDEINVYKLAGECISADGLGKEYRYTIPAVLTRAICEIEHGDGFSYCDKEGNIIAQYYKVGENWGTVQEALRINDTILNKGLEKHGYKMFWLFRDYREPTNKARERFDNILYCTDRSFIVWHDENEYRFKEIINIERPIDEQTKNALELNRFISQLLSNEADNEV